MASVFANLLKSISKPFRSGAETVRLATILSSGNNKKYRSYKPLFTDVEETRSMMENPIKSGVKDAAGIISFAVPSAKVFKGATAASRIANTGLQGAVSGALSGFGSSESGNEIGGTIAGAGTGAVAGGLVGGAVEGLSKIFGGRGGEIATKASKMGKLQRKALLNQASGSGLSDPIKSDDEIIEGFIKYKDALKKTGRNVGLTPRGTLENSIRALDDLKVQKTDAVSRISLTSDDIANVSDEINDDLVRMGNKISKRPGENKLTGGIKKAREEVDNLLSELFDNPSPKRADEIATELQSRVNYDAKVNRPGSTSVYDTASRRIRNLLKDLDTSGKYREVESSFSTLLDELGNNSSLRKTAKKATEGLKSPALANIEVPISPRGPVSLIKSVTGRGLEKAGKVGGKININNKGVDALVKLLSIGAASPTQPDAQVDAQTDMIPAGTPMEGPTSSQVSSYDMYQASPQVDTGREQAIVFLDLLSKGMKASEAKAVSEAVVASKFGTQGAAGNQKVTETQGKFLSAAESANYALNLLEGGQVKTGKVAKVKGSLERFTGSQNEAQTDYYAALDAARSVAVSALSGANVPPQEYARMAALVPDPGDEPRIAKQKLKSFIREMRNFGSRGRVTSSFTEQLGELEGGF